MMDTLLKSSLVLICLSSSLLSVTSLRCRLCQRASSLDGCDSHQECSSDEVCFMDHLVTEHYTTVYVGGCRARDVCSVTSSGSHFIVGKRAATELVACSRCCDSHNYCNENLCNIHNARRFKCVVTTDSFIEQCDNIYSNENICSIHNALPYVHCNDCGDHTSGRPAVAYPEDCGYTTICQPNEMCFSSTEMFNGIHLQHLTKCMNNKICTALMNATFNTYGHGHAVGRRYTDTICAVCCGDNMCNKYACETIKRRLQSLKGDGFLDVYTLKEII